MVTPTTRFQHHLNQLTTVPLVKGWKVILEDISSCDTAKLKMLNSSQENTHTTSSHLTKEKKHSEGFSVKMLIPWGKVNYGHWAQLDDIAYS